MTTSPLGLLFLLASFMSHDHVYQIKYYAGGFKHITLEFCVTTKSQVTRSGAHLHNERSHRYFNPPMILSIDPSKKSTGFVIAAPDGTIVDFNTLEFKKPDKKMKATAEKQHFNSVYSKVLVGLIDCYDIDTIITEYPNSSQNVTAAWYLAFVDQAISSVSLAKLGKEPLQVTPKDAKKSILGDLNASKEEAIEHALEKLQNNPPLLAEFEILPKYKQEAVADGIVILSHFIPKLETVVDNES